MSIARKTRILAAAKEFNVGKDTAVAFLKGKGFEIDETKPDPKISAEMYDALQKEYADDKAVKKESDSIELPRGGVASKAQEPISKDKKASKEESSNTKKAVPDKEKVTPKAVIDPKLEKKEKVEEKEEEIAKAKPKVDEADVSKITAEPDPVVPSLEKGPIKEEKKEANISEVSTPPVPSPKNTSKEELPKRQDPLIEKTEEKPLVKDESISEEEEKAKHIGVKAPTLDGPKVVATIDLDQFKRSERKEESPKKAPSSTPKKKKPVKEAHHKSAPTTEKPSEESMPSKSIPAKKEVEVKKESKIETTQIQKEAPAKEEPSAPDVVEHISMSAPRLEGPRVVGKIELPVETKGSRGNKERKKRKRIPVDKAGTTVVKGKKARVGQAGPQRPGTTPGQAGGPQRGKRTAGGGQDRRRGTGPKRAKTIAQQPQEIDAKEIQEKIRETQAKLAGGMSGGRGRGVKSRSRKSRRVEADKRAALEAATEEKVIQVTEYISVSEFANLLDVSFTDVISKCMSLGIMVSINQRLDAEVIELVASEFDTEVEFLSLEDTDSEEEELMDDPKDLLPRAPIVTIMGHVDHGKTSLLDYIRNATVVAGEAGGITQHIGAYKVTTTDGKQLAFLDTPGHEAFTAMRARGAKVADVAIIVVAADDAIMPQTKEAISHAQAAGLPMVFAINKIDKETANPEKIKEQLSAMNILVEDWGGTFQSQEISAKKGINIDELLNKVLLESEMLELTANPDREASGSVIEAELDKGRGYVSTVLVQSGTLKTGDMIVTGQYYGKVRAMTNERGQRVDQAGPSTPVQILGINGAPQAGERFRVYEDETEAKNIANHRAQILREQGLRSRKHITLDEIGRRLALGTFKELNIIIKADFDGSAEALSDSLQKLSTEEIHVNVVLKGVGQITESDVNLASASDAIIIGFQVRPSAQAALLAEEENIEIRNYSIIYDAIEELKSAMEGMLEPKFEKKVVGNIEVRETYKISALGTIAGCYVLDGKFTRNTQINLIRDGIVIHSGELASLKRFKDDVKEVVAGYECGLSLKGYNDIQVGDIIEGFEEVEIKRKL